MIHSNIEEEYEAAKTAINRLTSLEKVIDYQSSETRHQYRLDCGAAWSAVIKLMDDDQHRDVILTDVKSALEEILANVPEARVYFETTINVASKFRRAKQELETPFTRIRY